MAVTQNHARHILLQTNAVEDDDAVRTKLMQFRERIIKGESFSKGGYINRGFDDIDWRQLDPRQYDPRRIVREALMDDSPAKPSRPAPPPAAPREATHETPGPGSEGPPAVPFDDEAT